MSLYTLVADHYATGRGICSVCSSHPGVLEASMRQAVLHGTSVLIESTANQVDQFGGYTGMNPEQFRIHVRQLAERCGLPAERLLLGGDHLGPLSWRGEPAQHAMEKAETLVRAYAAAGFAKIHLDCSMSCADDAQPAPNPEVIVERAARLCRAAEDSALAAGHPAPVYVIGTEVPIPGGATHELHGGVGITQVADAEATCTMHQQAFSRLGLEAAWERVIALVVQPGVEFAHTSVVDYKPELAAALSQSVARQGTMLFEAHSTDYQPPAALQELVRDHFAILKVGPWLTWAWRQGLFALECVEAELVPKAQRSRLGETLETVMLADNRHWKAHYHGSEAACRLARRFSYSDRARYYWTNPTLQTAEQTLCRNLAGVDIPLPLLSQYFPREYEMVREGRLIPAPHALLLESVNAVLAVYAAAVQGHVS